MIGKFMLIALVCVSVAQVHGGELENAINNGLKKVKEVIEKGEKTLQEAVQEADSKAHLLDHNTSGIVEKSKKMHESSKAALRKIAEETEKKAKEANSPESVFQCIKSYEEGANKEIETHTKTFARALDMLRAMVVTSIFTATTALERMTAELKAKYDKTVADIKKCENAGCVSTLVSSCESLVSSVFASIRKVEGQITPVFSSFEKDSNNYFKTTCDHVNGIMSTATKNIKNCLNKK